MLWEMLVGSRPNFDDDWDCGQMPSVIGTNAKELLRGLLQSEPAHRIRCTITVCAAHQQHSARCQLSHCGFDHLLGVLVGHNGVVQCEGLTPVVWCSARGGAKAVTEHKFFSGLSMSGLNKGSVKPPKSTKGDSRVTQHAPTWSE